MTTIRITRTPEGSDVGTSGSIDSRVSGSAVSARRVGRWAAAAALVLVADVLISILHYPNQANGDYRTVDWTVVVATNVASNALWVPFAVLAVWLSVRWPITIRWWHPFVHVLGFAAVVLGRGAAVPILNPLITWYVVLPDWGEVLTGEFFNYLLYYVLMTGAAHAVYYADVARIRERQFGQARLDALVAQIHPHFLFNSLNAIAASVHDKPDVAEAMIVDLATLLRYSLDQDNAELVQLDDELAIAAAYLEIERHRFADRLTVQWQIDPALHDAAVPPFLLQPLLENAVRHGLRPRPVGTTTLTVHARRLDGMVELRVEDDGAGPPTEPAAGIGFSNITARLQHIYGSQAGLTIAPRPEGGTVASIRLPHGTSTVERLTT
jgi:two-component system, LytTR family, sensor kinase